MPWMPRPPQERPPEARRRLERFARDYERREREHDRAGERLRAERDEAIRQAHRDGLPTRDIAAIMHLSHQHVSRIVRG
jgi:DNA-directed RNA polymerase specialized sigma24 family protein